MATQAMFGAPLGILAREEQNNKTGLSQVQAQKLLGDIDQMPAETALRSAQARHYDAESGKLDAAAMDRAALARIEAINRVVPATQGRLADAGDADMFKSTSVAEPLRKLYDTAIREGAPASVYAPIAKQIADIEEKENIGAYRGAQAINERNKALENAADMVGSYAQAAKESPEGYAQMRMLATQKSGSLPPQVKQFIDSLPIDWEGGKKKLEMLIAHSMTVKDRIAAKQRQEEIDAKKRLEAGTQSKNDAAAATSKARLDLINEQLKNLKKNGGEGSPSVVAAREVSTAAKAQKMRADQLKTAPYAPLPGTDPTPGKVYTAKDGRLVRAGVKPDGSIGYQLMPGAQPWGPMPTVRDAATIRAATEEPDED